MTRLATVPGLTFEALRRAEVSPLRSDVTGFIGRTRRGPVGVRSRVDGDRELARLFGDLRKDAATSYAARSYFENGGQVAHVVRVCGGGSHVAAAEWEVGKPDGLGEAAHDPAVVEPPAARHRQARRVQLAQVVGVRVALGGQLVEPHGRAGVLVRQGDRGALGAPGSRALA